MFFTSVLTKLKSNNLNLKKKSDLPKPNSTKMKNIPKSLESKDIFSKVIKFYNFFNDCNRYQYNWVLLKLNLTDFVESKPDTDFPQIVCPSLAHIQTILNQTKSKQVDQTKLKPNETQTN